MIDPRCGSVPGDEYPLAYKEVEAEKDSNKAYSVPQWSEEAMAARRHV
jgi:hypothetical protein